MPKTQVRFYDRHEVFATTAQVIREFGWVSRTSANESGNVATADRVRERLEAGLIADPLGSDEAQEVWNTLHRTLMQQPFGNDYEERLKDAIAFDKVDGRKLAFAVSAVPYAQRLMKRQEEDAERAATSASNWVGDVKARLELRGLRVIQNKDVNDDWGQFRFALIKLEDGEGNLFCWFASKPQSFAEGDTIDLKATIKGHGEFRGVKETQLTRATVI